MQEIAYMAFQGWHQCFKHNAPGVSDNTWDNLDYFGLNPLIEYEGANISTVGTANYGHPDIYVMPGETLTVEGILSIDWGANAFSGSTFLPEWGIGLTGIPLTYDTSILPLPTVPGLQTVYLKGAYTNNSGGIQQVTPVKLTSPTGVNISGMSTTPYFLFSTITRTS
jgi:hypothetical protein